MASFIELTGVCAYPHDPGRIAFFTRGYCNNFNTDTIQADLTNTIYDMNGTRVMAIVRGLVVEIRGAAPGIKGYPGVLSNGTYAVLEYFTTTANTQHFQYLGLDIPVLPRPSGWGIADTQFGMVSVGDLSGYGANDDVYIRYWGDIITRDASDTSDVFSQSRPITPQPVSVEAMKVWPWKRG